MRAKYKAIYIRPHRHGRYLGISKDTILLTADRDGAVFRLVLFHVMLYWAIGKLKSAEFYIRLLK